MITVIKSNFFVTNDKVQNMLDVLVGKYPTLNKYLTQKYPAQKFQYGMFMLGWHTRIMPDGTVFSLNKLPGKKVKMEVDDISLLKLIGQFSNKGSSIEIMKDGKIEKIKLNENGDSISILDYVVKQDQRMKETGAEPVEEVFYSIDTENKILAELDESEDGPFIEIEHQKVEDPEKAVNEMLTKAVEKIEKESSTPKKRGRPKRQPFEKKSK